MGGVLGVAVSAGGMGVDAKVGVGVGSEKRAGLGSGEGGAKPPRTIVGTAVGTGGVAEADAAALGDPAPAIVGAAGSRVAVAVTGVGLSSAVGARMTVRSGVGVDLRCTATLGTALGPIVARGGGGGESDDLGSLSVSGLGSWPPSAGPQAHINTRAAAMIDGASALCHMLIYQVMPLEERKVRCQPASGG